MPSFTLKSLPVVLLVGASALAGPITRDQNDNNSGQGGCIKECTLSNGLELCNLDWQSISDPSNNYCPAGIGSHEEFMRYVCTCQDAMGIHNDGEKCSSLDLCPLLRHLSPDGNSGPYDGPRIPHGPANGDPGIPLPKPQSEQGDCPDLGLCPLIHDLLPGQLNSDDPGFPSTRPYENGQPGPQFGQSNDFGFDFGTSSFGGPYDNDVTLHAGGSSPQNDGLRIVTLPPTDPNDPQNDSQDHHLDITGNNNGPSSNLDVHADDSSRNLDVHAGGDNGSSRNLDVHAGGDNGSNLDAHAGNNGAFDPSLVRASVNNNNQQDPQRNVQNGINVNVGGQPGQNGLVDLRGPRNTDGENGECQQK